MKKLFTMIFTATVLSVFSLQAWADVITDLWDIHQGTIVTGTSTAGVYIGSDIRNMFGGDFGAVDGAEITIFPDAQIFGPGSLALVSWTTPTAIDLDRFVLSVAADGVYPYEPSTRTDPFKYNRSIQGFNLYASNSDLGVYADWGNPIYASGFLAAPLGTYANGLYFYTIDHAFSAAVSAQYFKADIIYGSYVTGPRIIELDGYGSTPNNNPVPEPATMILFGTGLAGLAAARRRKKAC
jgi:hypothetical protein